MDIRRIVFLAVAVILAGVIAVSVRSAAKPEGTTTVKAQAQNLPAILIAKVDMPAGTFVQPDHLAWQVWPSEKLSDAYLLKDQHKAEDFNGAVVRTGLRAGEPITTGRIVKPNERGFMAAVLNPGTRAVSVRVDETTGISGLVFPGDRVDVILTQTIATDDAGRGKTKRASETILTDIRVLAVDQRTDDIKAEAKVAKTATLEVTPKQAEKIALIADMGKISLSLRALSANTTDPITDTATPSFTWESDASYLLSPMQKPTTISIVRGNTVEDFLYKGGS